MGPGSPTYAVRQLAGSLAWYRLIARHRIGAALASAAVISVSAWALPVYEIYKAGHDLSWQPGLDLFGAYGQKLVFVPHWNNAEGGVELDTSCCFMGRGRFEALAAMLPPDVTVVGIDEHTALAVDLADGAAEVMGAGDVTVLHPDGTRAFAPGGRFSLAEFGPFAWPQPDAGLPAGVWAEALATYEATWVPPQAPAQVLALATERQIARERCDSAAPTRCVLGSRAWAGRFEIHLQARTVCRWLGLRHDLGLPRCLGPPPDPVAGVEHSRGYWAAHLRRPFLARPGSASTGLERHRRGHRAFKAACLSQAAGRGAARAGGGSAGGSQQALAAVDHPGG